MGPPPYCAAHARAVSQAGAVPRGPNRAARPGARRVQGAHAVRGALAADRADVADAVKRDLRADVAALPANNVVVVEEHPNSRRREQPNLRTGPLTMPPVGASLRADWARSNPWPSWGGLR